jgi:hypothetical protein
MKYCNTYYLNDLLNKQKCAEDLLRLISLRYVVRGKGCLHNLAVRGLSYPKL